MFILWLLFLNLFLKIFIFIRLCNYFITSFYNRWFINKNSFKFLCSLSRLYSLILYINDTLNALRLWIILTYFTLNRIIIVFLFQVGKIILCHLVSTYLFNFFIFFHLFHFLKTSLRIKPSSYLFWLQSFYFLRHFNKIWKCRSDEFLFLIFRFICFEKIFQ